MLLRARSIAPKQEDSSMEAWRNRPGRACVSTGRGGEERASAQPRGRSAASLGWPRERVSCVNSPGMSGTLPSAWVRTPGRGLRDIFRTRRWRDDLRPWHYALALRTGAGPQARRPTQRRSLQGLGAAHPSRQSQLPQRAERADVLICLGDLQVPRSLVHSGPRSEC